MAAWDFPLVDGDDGAMVSNVVLMFYVLIHLSHFYGNLNYRIFAWFSAGHRIGLIDIFLLRNGIRELTLRRHGGAKLVKRKMPDDTTFIAENPSHHNFTCYRHHRSSLSFTMVVQHLIGPSCFPVIPAIPTSSESLSVISYNVLLPNSVDGWWNYKMYLPPLSEEQKHWSTWEYRRDLLRDRLALVGTYWILYQ
jgi:hypothetical protein